MLHHTSFIPNRKTIMMPFIKTFNLALKLMFPVLLMALMSSAVQAQYLGSSAVTVGQVTTYTCLQCTGTPNAFVAENEKGENDRGENSSLASLPVPRWDVTGGSVLGVTTDSQSTSVVTVQWETAGSKTIKYTTVEGSWGSMGITVSSCTSLNTPTYQLSATVVCTGSTATITAAIGSDASTVRWYTAATGGTHFSEGLSYTTPALSAGTTTYYISAYKTSPYTCTSARIPVVLNVSKPQPPLLTVEGFIYGTGKAKLKAVRVYQNQDVPQAGTAKWYTQATGGTAFAQSLTYTTSLITTPVTYYVSILDSVTNCESARDTLTVNPVSLNTNQVSSDLVRIEGVTSTSGISSLTNNQKSTTLTHADGFMRPVQQTVLKATPLAQDILQPIEYDVYGQASKNYLPYSMNNTAGALDAVFKVNQPAFYASTSDKVADDTHPFALTAFEASPLGRVKEQGGVGTAFQPGTSHTQQLTYTYNDASEVRKFNTDGTSSAFYAANTLSKTIGTDAQGVKTIVYADSEGRTILKKQQLDEVIDGTTVDYLETYYLYDDLNRINYIISPKGVAALKSGSWSFTTDIRDHYTHQFVYDKRGRAIEKKVPGQAWTYYGYDNLNRLVLMQDGQLRTQNKWLFIKYDRKGRAVMQGLYKNTTQTTRSAVQTILDGLYTSSNVTYPEASYYESRGTTLHGHTNISFPKLNSDNSAIEIWNVMYYESHDFDYNGSRDYKYDSLSYSSSGQAYISNWRASGLPTGSKKLILGTSTWLYTYVYYDKYNRAIQVRSNNHLSTTVDNLATTVYDFEGKVLKTKNYHNAGSGKVTTVINKYEYDDKGRLLKVYQNNNAASTDQLVAQYEYNELGQLVDKKLHNTTSTNFLQSVDYRYTIKGKLASINNAQLNVNTANNDETTDYFGLELLYNTTESGLSSTSQYNGNISAIKWKGLGNGTGASNQKSYTFAYDKSNRLETATSQAYTGSAWSGEANALNESMSYDHNGNIKTLQRNQPKHQLSGLISSYTSETIDNLTYNYNTTIGDQLQKITDAASTNAASGFNNGSSGTSNDYTYDTQGNLTADQNKGISSIVYNELGKASQINFTDGRKIDYVFDASGAKLIQKLYQGSTLQATTDYVNGFVYENGTLNFFGSPEGRVTNNSGTLEYQYSLADHQGNTRVVFTSATPSAQTATANFESSSNSNFQNYANRVNFELMDQTDVSGSTYTYSQKLTGGSNSQIGVAKSLKVYPGDKVKIEAYAKYYNPTSTTSNLTSFAAALTGAFGVSSSSTGEALKAYNTLNNYGGIIAGGGSGGSTSYPKLFVNILLFDKDHNFLDAAWEQIDGGEQIGATPKAAHDYMSKEVTVKESGYAYVFISNESATLVEFYVDDVTVTHTPTNVIQSNEYYPFGLQTANSWTRENTKDNNYLYNAANELNKTNGWYEMFYRGYDPATGRMLQVDPLATKYSNHTAYNYAGNNPVMMNDPSGADMLKITNEWLNSNGWATSFDGNGANERELGGGSSNYAGNNSYYENNANAMSTESNLNGGSRYSGMARSMMAQIALGNLSDSQKADYIREYGTEVSGEMKYTRDAHGKILYGIDITIYPPAGQTQGGEQDPYGWGDLFGNAKTGASIVRGLASARRIMENEYIAQATINNSIRGVKAAVPNSLRTISTVSKVAGGVSIIASWGIAGYQVANGTDNTSTWVNAGVNTVLIGAAILGGPVTVGIATVGLIGYGVGYLIWGDEMDSFVDSNFGYR